MPKTTAAVTLNFQGPIFFCYTSQHTKHKLLAVIIGQQIKRLCLEWLGKRAKQLQYL
jgi:hypothetical protein